MMVFMPEDSSGCWISYSWWCLQPEYSVEIKVVAHEKEAIMDFHGPLDFDLKALSVAVWTPAAALEQMKVVMVILLIYT